MKTLTFTLKVKKGDAETETFTVKNWPETSAEAVGTWGEKAVMCGLNGTSPFIQLQNVTRSMRAGDQKRKEPVAPMSRANVQKWLDSGKWAPTEREKGAADPVEKQAREALKMSPEDRARLIAALEAETAEEQKAA